MCNTLSTQRTKYTSSINKSLNPTVNILGDHANQQKGSQYSNFGVADVEEKPTMQATH